MGTTKTYTYNAEVYRIVDGDTVYLKLTMVYKEEVDFGFHILDTVELIKTAIIDFRLLGINAPEMHGAEKSKGEASKEALANLISGKKLRVETSKAGKYGRWLAQIYVVNDNGTELDVNQWMLDNNFAAPYNP